MLKPIIPTSDAAPYELPLSHDQFRRAVCIGHGRAWQHVQRHGAAGLHSLIFDLAELCASVKRTECLPLMLFVYEYSPCGNCRYQAVKVMVELGIAPQWMIEECRFDAMDNIRDMFRGSTLAD